MKASWSQLSIKNTDGHILVELPRSTKISWSQLLSSFVLVGLTLGVSFSKAQMVPHVIYGDDNRRDLYQESSFAVLAIADATAAMFPNHELNMSPAGRYEYPQKSFESTYSLCPSEPFLNQPAAAQCSGFLVAENLLVTAGHCVGSEQDCEKNSWVFQFRMKNENEAPLAFEAENVYKCKRLVATKYANKLDYAIVELDRPVRGVRPLKMRSSAQNIKTGESVFVIGHPMGLPTKIADGASVRKIDSSQNFFVANLDTYGGNSGSAVLNSKTLEVEGVLVRGETDLVRDYGCYKSNRCPNDACRGEDVTLIRHVQEALVSRH